MTPRCAAMRGSEADDGLEEGAREGRKLNKGLVLLSGNILDCRAGPYQLMICL